MKRKPKMLTPRQYAEQQGVAYTTVMNWLQQGKIPEAVKHETPTGHYWELPEVAPKPELQPGRPPKPKEEVKAEKSAARKRVRKKDSTRLLKTLS
jgi:hypothetical protein